MSTKTPAPALDPAVAATPHVAAAGRSIADILERAADRLSEPGEWGQGRGPVYGNCCAQLAIAHQKKATGRDAVTRAEAFFAKFIGGRGDCDIWDWNDRPERTQEEVVAKLHEAAALAREQGA